MLSSAAGNVGIGCGKFGFSVGFTRLGGRHGTSFVGTEHVVAIESHSFGGTAQKHNTVFFDGSRRNKTSTGLLSLRRVARWTHWILAFSNSLAGKTIIVYSKDKHVELQTAARKLHVSGDYWRENVQFRKAAE